MKPPIDHSRAPTPDAPQDGWIDALVHLVSSRISLIELEARDAANRIKRRSIRILAACGLIMLAWLLVLSGTIAWLSSSFGLPWHWLAIVTGFVHGICGLALLSRSRPEDPPFTHSRAEFQKDRQWLETIKLNKNESGN